MGCLQHPPFRGPLYVLLDGGAPDLTVAAPVSRRLVALASPAHHAKTTNLRDRGDEEIFDLLKFEHLAPLLAHSCEQVWVGGRRQSTLIQNGYGVPEFFKDKNIL